MGLSGADWLDRNERESEEHPDKAIAELNLKPGMFVGDVGAGTGFYSLRIAKLIGKEGVVYANDIQPGMLDRLNANASAQHIGNVVTILGTESDPKLPAGKLDMVILVDVYHEFSRPQRMLDRIRDSLKPDGRLVLLEFRKEDPSVPIRPEHKMSVQEVKAEIIPEGYRFEKVVDTLPWQHIIFLSEIAAVIQSASLANFSRYQTFNREQWKALRAHTPLLLTEEELQSLRGINESVSVREVEEVFVPLSRLLNLHVAAVQHLYEAKRDFIGSPAPASVPYIIGIAGSVAVGKSTFSRVLRAALARWRDHPNVALVTTDGFLHPNAVLEARGLMQRKGFPESYDQRRLLQFLADVKSGEALVTAPVYSHLLYDIVPAATQEVAHPDILIIEGLNVLQSPESRDGSRMFVSDFFDFSIYLDAGEDVIENWYVKRFLRLRETVFRNPSSYFHRYAALTEPEAIDTARRIWEEINLKNLRENIGPTRDRAHLILEKGRDHLVENVKMRRV